MVNFSNPISGINTNLLRQDVTSNNIANLNTSGFKASRASSADLNPSGTFADAISKDMSQGSLMVTGDKFNLAISGNGFFKVDTPNGPAYTRSGNFQIDANGRVVTAQGYPVVPELNIPHNAENVTISKSGEVYALQNGQNTKIGQIEITDFSNPAGLSKTGENLYNQTANSGQGMSGMPGIGGRGQIAQGYLETSNVNLANEFTNSIVNQRAFEANIKVVKTMDEMSQDILNII